MKAAFVLSLLLGFAACSDDDGGDPVADAQVAVDAGTNAPDAMPGAPLTFMTECDVADDQCDTAGGDFCFSFNMRGSFCTHDCMDETMCAAPSRGCNGQGVCKSPE